MNSKSKNFLPLASRRQFVLGASATVAASLISFPARPAAKGAIVHKPVTLSGEEIKLQIGYHPVNFTGVKKLATAVNGSVPAPTIRLKEGQRVTLHVTNTLDQDSSIHWHGIILPTEMDGVPGLSFAGIKPGETFTYQFDALQSGTYWYHSHSGFQEQTGLYGALIIDPQEHDPVRYDREYTVLLSDWTDEDPHHVYATLKKLSHYYNFSERTVADWWRDVREKGFAGTWRERRMWNQMRMSNTDIADVNGSTYTYLMNGVTPDTGWTGLFEKGEKVRLRFINASAMSIFDVRLPGLKMTVVAADGQNIQPVMVDEFRIGTAETYDVVVEPKDDRAYTVFAQSIDRTGYARGTLTPDVAMLAEIPAMDHAPVLTHADMGMGHGHADHGAVDHSQMDHSQMDHGEMDHSQMDHSQMDHSQMDHSAMGHGEAPTDHGDHQAMDHKTTDHKAEPVVDHSQHDHSDHDGTRLMPPADSAAHTHGSHGGTSGIEAVAVTTANLGKAGHGSNAPIQHLKHEFGPHVDMRAQSPVDGINDPGIGLREHMQRYGRRVLTYADLKNLTPTIDRREPERELQIHLTGNMGRYMWSMNGVTHADAAPIQLRYGERIRIVLVNDTMMTHPIHLHGMWSELETGDPDFIPRKHTVLVQPGSKVSYLVTADAKGRWAYHCHLLFHMPGMMREVAVS